MADDRGERALARLLQLVGEYQAGSRSEASLREALAADVDLGELVRREAGGAIERGGAVIAFGAHSQAGDLQIRDVAGHDIINLTINLSPQHEGAASSALDDEELAQKRRLIAQHRTMLHALELQAAKFGIYAPPHITIEIEDLKRTIATLRREVGDG